MHENDFPVDGFYRQENEVTKIKVSQKLPHI